MFSSVRLTVDVDSCVSKLACCGCCGIANAVMFDLLRLKAHCAAEAGALSCLREIHRKTPRAVQLADDHGDIPLDVAQTYVYLLMIQPMPPLTNKPASYSTKRPAVLK